MITIPKLSELYSQIISDIESAFSVTLPTTGKNFLRAFSAVQAGKLKLLYLVIGNLQKNVAPDTADSELKGGTLERFGRIKLGRNPFPARAGQYELIVNGQPGAIITANTTLKSNDDSTSPGKMFVLDDEYLFTDITGLVTVRALESGNESSLGDLDKLTFTKPIANVNSIATVNSVVEEPAAAETLEAYRQKILNAERLETQGGAATDYRLWSQDAQGVERVYPYARSGERGVIDIYIEATIDDSIDGKGTPSQALIDDVESVIEYSPDETLDEFERGRRPLGAEVYYFPITPVLVIITINDFIGLTTEIETAIESELKAKINLIRPFVASADVLEDRNDILDVNRIISIILSVRPGSSFGNINLNVAGVDVMTYQFERGEIPSVENVIYA